MIEGLLRTRATELHELAELLTAAADALAAKDEALLAARANLERLRTRLDQLERALGSLEHDPGLLWHESPHLCLEEDPDRPGVLCIREKGHGCPCGSDHRRNPDGSTDVVPFREWGGYHDDPEVLEIVSKAPTFEDLEPGGEQRPRGPYTLKHDLGRTLNQWTALGVDGRIGQGDYPTQELAIEAIRRDASARGVRLDVDDLLEHVLVVGAPPLIQIDQPDGEPPLDEGFGRMLHGRLDRMMERLADHHAGCEPPPEDYGPPLEPRGGSTSTTTPLARFRKRLRARIRAYVLVRFPTQLSAWRRETEQRIYEACKLAWYGDVTFSEEPEEGQEQVHGAWYLPGGPYSHRVGSMSWLQSVTDSEFAAAVDAVLGVSRG